MLNRLLFFSVLLILLAGLCSDLFAQRVPQWIHEAAARDTSEFWDVDAVVLHEEREIEVAANGRITTVLRRCLLITKIEGAYLANFSQEYTRSGDRIRGINIWILDSSLKGRTYNQRDCTDVAITQVGTVFSDYRSIKFDARYRIRSGEIFAYEIRMQTNTFFPFYQWNCHRSIPVLNLSVQVKLPTNWTLTWHETNQPITFFEQSGTTYTWLTSNIPALDLDAWYLPAYGDLATSVWVQYHPPEGARTPFLRHSSWQGWASYWGTFDRASAVVTEDIRAHANKLCEGLNTPLERIQEIATYVQSVNYALIATDLTRGGGFKPMPASDVLRNNYGDCKGKSVLMTALLEAMGIKSWGVGARIGDNLTVDPDMPTPYAFDHQIVAILVGEDIDLPSIVDHPELGRLLFFDPTDSVSRLGDLSKSLQGNLVLVCDPMVTGLTQLPYIGGEMNSDHRTIRGFLSSSGHLHAKFDLRANGQEAAGFIQRHRNRSAQASRDAVKAWIRQGTGVAVVDDVIFDIDRTASVFSVSSVYSVPHYARPIGRDLLVFNPVMVTRFSNVPPDEERIFPVILHPWLFSEDSVFALPEDWIAEDAQIRVELNEEFGTYLYALSFEDGQLKLERQLEFKASRLPATDYSNVRKFMETIVETEQRPVVLRRL